MGLAVDAVPDNLPRERLNQYRQALKRAPESRTSFGAHARQTHAIATPIRSTRSGSRPRARLGLGCAAASARTRRTTGGRARVATTRLRCRRLARADDLPRALPLAGRGRRRVARADWGLDNTRRPRLVARARVPARCRRARARYGLRGFSRRPPTTARSGTRCRRSARADRGQAARDRAGVRGLVARASRPVGRGAEAALSATAAFASAVRRSPRVDSLWDPTQAAARERLPPAARRPAQPAGLAHGCSWRGRAAAAALPADARRRRFRRAASIRATALRALRAQARRGCVCGLRRVLPRGFRSRAGARARPMARRHPRLVHSRSSRSARSSSAGAASRSTATVGRAPYRCRVYADRPRACAEFAVGGDACL